MPTLLPASFIANFPVTPEWFWVWGLSGTPSSLSHSPPPHGGIHLPSSTPPLSPFPSSYLSAPHSHLPAALPSLHGFLIAHPFVSARRRPLPGPSPRPSIPPGAGTQEAVPGVCVDIIRGDVGTGDSCLVPWPWENRVPGWLLPRGGLELPHPSAPGLPRPCSSPPTPKDCKTAAPSSLRSWGCRALWGFSAPPSPFLHAARAQPRGR